MSTTEGMGGYAQVWDARAGAPVRDAQTGKPSPDFLLTQLSVCAISAEGEQVAIFYVDGTTARIELWSAQGQLLKTVSEVPRKILPVSISFQPDGNLLYKFDDSSPSGGLGGLPITRTFLWDVGSDQITEQTRDYERFLFPSPEGSLEANIRLSAICHAGTMEPVCFLQGLTGG